ncbi:hypothetical protein FQN49_002776 [Arthroderma sp. PD_2]|nr:hypothetical protein FQN49_002776 [Arthroderma sp. PD_2]
MDPITIIGLLASISNLVVASGETITLVKSFKDGEREIGALAKELLVFQESLKGFDRVLRSRQTNHNIAREILDHAIEDAATTLAEIQDRLSQIAKSENSAVRRMKWVKHKTYLEKTTTRIRGQCQELNNFVIQAIFETVTLIGHENSHALEICGSVREEMEAEISSDAVSNGSMASAYQSREPHIELLECSSSQRSLPSARQLLMVPSSGTDLAVKSSSASVVSSRSSISSSHSSIFSSAASKSSVSTCWPSGPGDDVTMDEKKPDEVQPSSSELQIIRRACRYDCYCKCHAPSITVSKNTSSKFNSPIVQGDKGDIVECTEPDCSRASSTKSRIVSSRFLRKAVSMLVSSHSVKARYNLNTYRMVPEGSNAMRYIKHGNLEKLKYSIESGETTIWDTAPDGWSLLHTAAYARQLPIVKYLYDLGADTEAGDLGARKPADLAILKSLGVDGTAVEEAIVEIFSKKDDYISDFEFTPIHIAVLDLYDTADRERPSLEELIEFVDSANNAPPGTNWSSWKAKYKKRSPLFLSVIEQFRTSSLENTSTRKVIHNFLDQKDRKFHWTPLHWASSTGRSDKMKILVDKGADPFIQSNLNANILHAAVESNALDSLSYALEICRLYPNQLDINQANVWGETPLIMAAQGCLVDCVRLLINAGADRNIRQENEQVALHYAGLASMSKNRRETVSLLCAGESGRSSHINAQDEDGRTPLFDLLDDQECVKLLVKHGAKLDVLDNSGKSLFHHACNQNLDQTLKLLLCLIWTDSSVSPRSKDDTGDTALMTALRHGNVRCAMTLLKLDDVGEIVGQGGWAAVHYATKLGNSDLLEAVLKHPSFVKGMKTDDGKTAQDIAMEAGTWCGQIKDLLRKHNSTVTSLSKPETT